MSKTYGQMMEEALSITTQDEADKFFLRQVSAMKEGNQSWSMEKCAEVVRSNLGYMAGYYDKSASIHVHKFFGAAHPIFGGPGYWDTMKPEKAFQLGRSLTERSEKEK